MGDPSRLRRDREIHRRPEASESGSVPGQAGRAWDGGSGRSFQLASGRFAWLLYKEDIETALRTPNFGGVQLLQLQDFPGQGEALIGLLDPFWDSKGILEPAEMRSFFSESRAAGALLQIRMDQRREPSARGSSWLTTVSPICRVPSWNGHWATRAAPVLASGKTPPSAVKRGQVVTLGEARAVLDKVPCASRLRLEARLTGAPTANRWDIWVYPKPAPDAGPGGVLVTGALDSTARRKLEEGGKVLLVWPGNRAGSTPFPLSSCRCSGH